MNPRARCHFLGWKKDRPDSRDRLYAPPPAILKALPPSTDLRPMLSGLRIFDQGQLGSCTANAIAAAHFHDQVKQMIKGTTLFTPSRLFIYYNERSAEGTVMDDSGAFIRDGIKSIAREGVCSETLWKYDITRFKSKPPAKCYTEALKHQAVQYFRVGQTLDLIRACLAEGWPIVFGFTVYESFESAEVARTGLMPMPGRRESSLGGHAVLAVGYDDSTRRVTVRNSWSDQWGDKGHFYMPYDFITSSARASDFWKVTQIEQ